MDTMKEDLQVKDVGDSGVEELRSISGISRADEIAMEIAAGENRLAGEPYVPPENLMFEVVLRETGGTKGLPCRDLDDGYRAFCDIEEAFYYGTELGLSQDREEWRRRSGRTIYYVDENGERRDDGIGVDVFLYSENYRQAWLDLNQMIWYRTHWSGKILWDRPIFRVSSTDLVPIR